LPCADGPIGVTNVEGVAISRPGKGEGLGGFSCFGLEVLGVLVELSDDALALQIPDLDSIVSGSAQPVSVGAEDEGVDDVSSVEGVEVLALVEIPQAGCSVLATRSTERTVWADCGGVEVTSVANEVGLQLAVGEIPHLDQLVPTSGDDDGVLGVGGEAHAADPLGVSVLLNGVLALTNG